MRHIRTFEDKTPQIAEDAWVDHTAVVIGDVTLGPGASVWPYCVVRGDIHRIEIGAETNIQDGSILHVDAGFPLRVGARVTVGHAATLHGCTIENLCLIGMGSILMDGAIVTQPVTLM